MAKLNKLTNTTITPSKRSRGPLKNVFARVQDVNPIIDRVNGDAAGQERSTVTTLTAASSVSVVDSGKVFVLNSATEFDTTLPTPSSAGSGWKCTFIVGAAPSGAAYTVTAPSNVIHGLVVTADVGQTSPGTDASSTGGTAVDVITFADGVAAIGDRVELLCDGTSFFAKAYTTTYNGITLA